MRIQELDHSSSRLLLLRVRPGFIRDMSPSAQGRHTSLPVTSAAAAQKLATPETYKPHNFRDAKSRRPDRQWVIRDRIEPAASPAMSAMPPPKAEINSGH